MISSCHVSQVFTYPVKSLQGISSDTFQIDDFGFKHDRRFMLVDENNKFITQRTHPKLALLSVDITLSSLGALDAVHIFSEEVGRLTFPIHLFKEHLSPETGIAGEETVVWGDSVKSCILDASYTEKISHFLGVNARLAYMPDSSFRQVDREFFSEDKRVSFADAYPFLLTSEASLADLNARLEQPVLMTNFRPNIVISGGVSAYAEDVWQRIIIGDIAFELVKPCSRCVMTTINAKGEKSKNQEPLRTLSKYRKNDFGVCFGQNLVHLSQGIIRVGDRVSFE